MISCVQYRAVNPHPPHHQILRTDTGRNGRWHHITLQNNDVFCAKKSSLILSSMYIAHKQFILYQNLWENVPAAAQTMQNIWNFMVGKTSVQEIAILAIIREVSDSNIETGRYSPKSGVCWIIQESWQYWQ